MHLSGGYLARARGRDTFTFFSIWMTWKGEAPTNSPTRSKSRTACVSSQFLWARQLWFLPKKEILTITSWLLVWVILWFGGDHRRKLLWGLLGGHRDAGSPKGVCGLHPCRNVTKRLVGTLGWQPGRVGHGSDLRGDTKRVTCTLGI